MLKHSKIHSKNILIAIILLILGGFIFFIYLNVDKPTGSGSVLEFKTNSATTTGFSHKNSIYTNDLTSITLFGNITINGIGEIKVTSDKDNKLVYSKTFSYPKSEQLNIKLNDLSPNSYYTIVFSSDNSSNGNLRLKSDVSLVKKSDKPEKPSK